MRKKLRSERSGVMCDSSEVLKKEGYLSYFELREKGLLANISKQKMPKRTLRSRAITLDKDEQNNKTKPNTSRRKSEKGVSLGLDAVEQIPKENLSKKSIRNENSRKGEFSMKLLRVELPKVPMDVELEKRSSRRIFERESTVGTLEKSATSLKSIEVRNQPKDVATVVKLTPRRSCGKKSTFDAIEKTETSMKTAEITNQAKEMASAYNVPERPPRRNASKRSLGEVAPTRKLNRKKTKDVVSEPEDVENQVSSVDTKRKYCEYCNVGFNNQIRAQKHSAVCKLNPKNEKAFPGIIYYCKVCHFGIADEEFFKEHEARCQNTFLNREISYSSGRTSPKLKRKRAEIGKFKCPDCFYTTDNMGHLKGHARIHSKIPLCICDVCRKGFNRIDSLRRHMFRHLGFAEECKVLESVNLWDDSATKTTMQVRILGRNFKIVKYQCGRCEYATPIVECLDKHISCVHLKNTEFKCKLCPFSCTVKNNMRQHLNWHTKEKTFKCSYCSYETITKTYIKKHENQVHLRTKTFSCDRCEYKAYTKENVKCHINSVHSKAKKYDCTICDFFSYDPSNLINHVKGVHEGKKRKN